MTRLTRLRGSGRGWPTVALALAAALVLAAAAPADTVNLWDNLISNWAFDEGTGTLVDDGTGSNDATLTATGVGWIGGKIGAGAIQCTPNLTAKTGGGATLPSPLDPGTSALTLAAWINLDMLPGAMPSTNPYGGILDSAGDQYVMYAQRSTGELRFKITTDTAGSAITTIPASVVTAGGTGSWHHVAGVYDGQSIKTYFDGQLQSTTYTLVPSTIKAGQAGAFGYAPTATNAFFPGSIDDAALWGRALGAEEIAYLYNGGAGTAVKAANPVFSTPPTPSMPLPVVRLSFDGNLTNTGTGGPAAAVLVDQGEGTMEYVAGPIGQAMDLTQVAGTTKPPAPEVGQGTFARLDYTLGDQGTIAFWAKPKAFYDWNELLDNNNEGSSSSSPQEDWEMWVYGNGNARFRVEDNAYVTKALSEADVWHHFTMTWSRDVAAGGTNVRVAMYVDGEFAAIDASGTWIAPGTAIGIGGGLLNAAGNVVFDEFRIYDEVLTPDQIRAVYAIPEPGTVALLLSALLIAPLAWRRRK